MHIRLITTTLLSISVSGCSLLPWFTGDEEPSPAAAQTVVAVHETRGRPEDAGDAPDSADYGAGDFAIGGAMLGAGAGLAAGLAACTPSLLVPIAYPLCVGMITLTATTAGTAAGAMVGAEHEARAGTETTGGTSW